MKNLTKSYGANKGVFGLSFEVKKGEVFGFIGPNGAGKTTTIRHLLGFINPEDGEVSINNLSCFENASLIQKNLGYLPGEIAFFNHMKGLEFLTFIGQMRGLADFSKRDYLVSFLDLDLSGKIKKMSKGMKQKLAIVAAFMHNPDILILDEPTSGLDPLMQIKFVELILEEKKLGKTILMSSHSFEEIERTCDRALIIKNGKLVALEDIKKLKETRRKAFLVTLTSKSDELVLLSSSFEIVKKGELQYLVYVSGDINHFIQTLSTCDVKTLSIPSQSLEEIFMNYYQEDTLYE